MRYITCSATILDMRTTALLAALVLTLPVAAQTAKPAPPAAKPVVAPAITSDQRAAYWKAATQQANAQKQLDAANTAVTQAVQEMVTACGKDSNLTQVSNGDPVCVLIPKPAEKK